MESATVERIERERKRSKVVTLEETLFPVKKVKQGDGWAVVDDNGEVLADVSEKYELVQNERLITPFIKAFGEKAITQVNRFGNAFWYQIETGREFKLTETKDRKVGDLIRERLVIQNSYNKSRSYSFMFGAFRLVCTNGLYTGQMTLAFRKVHVGEIPVDEMIAHVLKNYKENNFDLWRKMQKHSMTTEQEVKVLNRFKAFQDTPEDQKKKPGATKEGRMPSVDNDVLNEDIRKHAIELVKRPEGIDNQRNAWGLYNAINQSISKARISKNNIPKILIANRNAEDYLTKTLSLN